VVSRETPCGGGTETDFLAEFDDVPAHDLTPGDICHSVLISFTYRGIATAQLVGPFQAFFGEVNTQRRGIWPCLRSGLLNVDQSRHVVKVVMRQQNGVNTLNRDYQFKSGTGHGVYGAGVDQEPGAVISVVDNDCVGAVR